MIWDVLRSNQRRATAQRYLPDRYDSKAGATPIVIGFPSYKLAFNQAVSSFERFGLGWSSTVAADEFGKLAAKALAKAVYLTDPFHSTIAGQSPSFPRVLRDLGFSYFPESHAEVAVVRKWVSNGRPTHSWIKDT